ncbi:MAG: alpha/beta hydrolase [Cyanobacteria bacterium P01_H01_bin.162]
MRSLSVSQKFTRRLLNTAVISLLSGIVATLPARSADKIYFDYGPFGRSLPVSSLEAFAEDGTVDADLAPYINRLPDDRQQDFQRFLSTPLPTLSPNIPEAMGDPFALSQWLYTPIGETVLTGFGQMIETESGENGQRAIRAAILLAAADPDGLSLLNIIRHYPTGGVRLNLQQIQVVARTVTAGMETTDELLSAAAQSAQAAAVAEPTLDYSALPLLADNGSLAVEQRSLLLDDSQRDRTYPVDLYLPANLSAVTGPIPVVVFSHGFGDTRRNPQAITAAQGLASNGFMVAVPEHIGSNKTYQDGLAQGLHSVTFEATEFIDRPLDIRFLLDTLEQKNSSEFQGRLQLENVGMIGHSFGGYTALATAGGTVDINYLQQQCDLEAELGSNDINVALLLACRALELAEVPGAIQQLTDGSLGDDRIGFVFALSPVSSLFGDTGLSTIQMPVVLMGGETDMATPVALEQLIAFQGLTTPERYLYLAENISHSPELTRLVLDVTSSSNNIVELFDENENTFSNLVVSLGIAHGKLHLLNDESYRPYLTAAYAEAASVEPVNLYLLRSVPDGF